MEPNLFSLPSSFEEHNTGQVLRCIPRPSPAKTVVVDGRRVSVEEFAEGGTIVIRRPLPEFPVG
jgi:hypothetical protein